MIDDEDEVLWRNEEKFIENLCEKKQRENMMTWYKRKTFLCDVETMKISPSLVDKNRF